MKLVKAYTFSRDRIHVRRLQYRITVKRTVPVSLVICKYYYYIRMFRAHVNSFPNSLFIAGIGVGFLEGENKGLARGAAGPGRKRVMRVELTTFTLAT
jgi:hypothetical protein